MFFTRFSSHISLWRVAKVDPIPARLSFGSSSDEFWLIVDDPQSMASDRPERGELVLNHRRRQRNPGETLDEMPLEGVSSSFFGITCWYRAVTPVTVLYRVAHAGNPWLEQHDARVPVRTRQHDRSMCVIYRFPPLSPGG